MDNDEFAAKILAHLKPVSNRNFTEEAKRLDGESNEDYIARLGQLHKESGGRVFSVEIPGDDEFPSDVFPLVRPPGMPPLMLPKTGLLTQK